MLHAEDVRRHPDSHVILLILWPHVTALVSHVQILMPCSKTLASPSVGCCTQMHDYFDSVVAASPDCLCAMAPWVQVRAQAMQLLFKHKLRSDQHYRRSIEYLHLLC